MSVEREAWFLDEWSHEEIAQVFEAAIVWHGDRATINTMSERDPDRGAAKEATDLALYTLINRIKSRRT